MAVGVDARKMGARPMTPATPGPAYWILMGATAITVLAGAISWPFLLVWRCARRPRKW